MLQPDPARRRPVQFPLGEVAVTPAALVAVTTAGLRLTDLLDRHARGDHGTLCAEAREVNRQALLRGCRVLSQYEIDDERVEILTERPRDRTTVLLAREC